MASNVHITSKFLYFFVSQCRQKSGQFCNVLEGINKFVLSETSVASWPSRYYWGLFPSLSVLPPEGLQQQDIQEESTQVTWNIGKKRQCWWICETVAGGVMHFTFKREDTICFIVVANFSSSCDCVLTGFDGKVHSTIYSIEGRVRQSCQGGPFIEPRVSDRAPLLSKLLREEFRWGWIQSWQRRLGQWFMSEGLHVHNQSFVSLSWAVKVWHTVNHLLRMCCCRESLTLEV